MTIAFELEGVLAYIFDNENECKYDAKINLRTSGNNIINYKDYFIKFRPYMKEMLRGLRPFFEILVYTSKGKDEAEAIVNALESDESFFAYIVPFNYCYYIPEERT